MTHDESGLAARAANGYARIITGNPGLVLAVLVALTVVATWGATKLTINSNQLDLISQELPEVKEVKRIIDMVGGTGHMIFALRSDDEKQLKLVGDELAAKISADKERVRNLTYKVPVEFVQANMVLFIKNEDLVEAKRRIMAYVRDQVRRNNPFFFELTKTEPVKLDLQDLIDKYSTIGKKTILDDYYISPDRKMLLLLIKPMWDSNKLDKTAALVEHLNQMMADYSKSNPHGIKLVEDYKLMGTTGTVAYGFTGSYKTNLDDSYAIADSLHPVTIAAFIGIFLITILFFRKVAPTFIVMIGVAMGTVLTMGWTYLTIGELNMVTSILAGILMGFGVDYGIHFTYRTRIELGLGKPYDKAIYDALVNAGRPAFVASVVTAGSFLVLLVSEFRGFSQFGFLCACGVMITAFTLFSFCPALLILLGRRWPALPERLIGKMELPKSLSEGGDVRVPRPKLVLGIGAGVVGILCLVAVPWTDTPAPKDRSPTLWERIASGIRFEYNTRSLMPEDQYSVQLQDEVNERFKISSDPTAVYTKDLDEALLVYKELTGKPEKYTTIDQVVSLHTFVPPRENAEKNAKVLAEWKEELKEIDPSVLPEDQQKKVPLFMKILDAKPFGVDDVPELYRSQFRHREGAAPENHGILTFIYPRVDLWDGKQMLEFSDQTSVIRTEDGREFRSAGLPVLYAKLARIVLWDGKVTVILVAIWILLMHFLDFRRPLLALASVIPLVVGVVMTLGIMSLTDERLNFMNIIILPILLGFGVSHGLYLLHRFLEGTSPMVALRSVGAAVASSTLTAVAGFAALFAASHNGLKSMGLMACLGLLTTLVVSFTVLAAVLQLLHDKRSAVGAQATPAKEPPRAAVG